ncbi:MAG: helix-turn-helix domain-containing protein [Alphaproteobacteria bacterium]|nr:helix-turn-helix domain-containing protein [Alphaproteobacteria bacterium]MCA3565981.1 helix-turn-helix domain-containing protein [Bradyrhizobium sp.]
MKEALESAITVAGSQSELARRVGVTQSTLWGWLNKAGRTPAEYVLKIEAATGVSRSLLRPDLYPSVDPADDASTAAAATRSSDSSRAAIPQERAA